MPVNLRNIIVVLSASALAAAPAAASPMPPPHQAPAASAKIPTGPDAALLRAALAKARSLGLNPLPAYVDDRGKIVLMPGTKCAMQDGRWVISAGDVLINVGRRPMPAGDGILWAGQCAVLKDGKIARFADAKSHATTRPTPPPRPADWPTRYRWKSKWSMPSVAASVCVREIETPDGKRKIRVRLAKPGRGHIPAMGRRPVVDLPGSRDIRVEVDPAVKVTHFVGLAFTTPCILSIDKDGTVVADTAGIVAPDARGVLWRSRAVAADSTRNAFFAFRPAPRGTTRPARPPRAATRPASSTRPARTAPPVKKPPPARRPGKSTPVRTPRFTRPLQGRNPVRVRNPNTFRVRVALRSGGGGKDFLVGAGGVTTVHVPDGRYDIYFVYSSQPEALYKGDSFTLRKNGVEIQIVKVVGGNYGIRRVK